MASKKLKSIHPTSGKVSVRINERTIIYVEPDKVKGAKERFMDRLDASSSLAKRSGRPGRPRK